MQHFAQLTFAAAPGKFQIFRPFGEITEEGVEVGTELRTFDAFGGSHAFYGINLFLVLQPGIAQRIGLACVILHRFMHIFTGQACGKISPLGQVGRGQCFAFLNAVRFHVFGKKAAIGNRNTHYRVQLRRGQAAAFDNGIV